MTLLDLPDAPTAIIAADSLMTFGVLEVLRRRQASLTWNRFYERRRVPDVLVGAW